MKKIAFFSFFVLLFLLGLEFQWHKSYQLIRIQHDNPHPLTHYAYPTLLGLYLLYIYPFVLKRFIPLQGVASVVIYGSLTLITFTPAMLLSSFPYDKTRYECYEVRVQERYKSKSGGSAPIYHLYTSSWRGEQERFHSTFHHFKGLKKGDFVEVKIAKDLLDQLRVISLKKVTKRETQTRASRQKNQL
jgi:hypothetical protein